MNNYSIERINANMPTKTLKKPHAPHCVAICQSLECYENNAPNYYIGRARFYDDDMYLFFVDSEIKRITASDALLDAIDIAKDSGF